MFGIANVWFLQVHTVVLTSQSLRQQAVRKVIDNPTPRTLPSYTMYLVASMPQSLLIKTLIFQIWLSYTVNNVYLYVSGLLHVSIYIIIPLGFHTGFFAGGGGGGGGDTWQPMQAPPQPLYLPVRCS